VRGPSNRRATQTHSTTAKWFLKTLQPLGPSPENQKRESNVSSISFSLGLRCLAPIPPPPPPLPLVRMSGGANLNTQMRKLLSDKFCKQALTSVSFCDRKLARSIEAHTVVARKFECHKASRCSFVCSNAMCPPCFWMTAHCGNRIW
jgi:hypothetical protein